MKKNCKYEYKEIDYQLKIQKRKKKHAIYNLGKENPVQTIKIAVEKQRSSREEKEKLISNGLSNSSCNLLTIGVERKQFKIYI